MRRYLIGFLVGIVLSISATTYASDITTLIGKSVQGVFPVMVNGDVLPKTAIVIEGTSYLPVRAIGDAIGYDVSFNADLGIELKKKEAKTMSTVTPSTTTAATMAATTVTDTVYLPEYIDTKIRFTQGFMRLYEYDIQNSPNDPNINVWKAELKKYQDELSIWEARKPKP